MKVAGGHWYDCLRCNASVYSSTPKIQSLCSRCRKQERIKLKAKKTKK